MAKLFVYSTAYVGRMIVHSAPLLFEQDTNEIILLSENHSEKDFLDLTQIKVTYCDTPIEAIHLSDMVIICLSENMPSEKVEYVKLICEKCKKTCYLMHADFLNKVNDNINATMDFSSSILIANIATSSNCNQLYIELLLNKILSMNKITFKQTFSPNTTELLRQLESQGILNSKITPHLHSTTGDTYNVNIIGINLYGESNTVDSELDNIKKYNPDYIILQTDYKQENLDLIKNILKYRCNTNCDYIIKSRYIEVENLVGFKIYCSDNERYSCDTLDEESQGLIEDLAFNIFSQLSLPTGISKI